MKIKNITVGMAGVFLIVAAGLPQTALAEKEVQMDLRFAGSLLTNASLAGSLVDATAVGSPGKANIRGYGGTEEIVGFVLECLGSLGPHIQINIVQNPPLVFTFNDLSQLFGRDGSGTICVDLTTGLVDFEINLIFDGGRGRFAGATGGAVIRAEAEDVSSDSAGLFLSETGTIVGTIVLP